MPAEVIYLHVWNKGPEPQPPDPFANWHALTRMIRSTIVFVLAAIIERIAPEEEA